jgi:cytochrome c-type biogenesis protein CcmH
MARWLVLLCMALAACAALAREAAPAAADPDLEARMLRIASELRCLVCQNQTIADSHAALAVDLREQVRELLRAGKSDADVVAYMTARYGDFVLYRPPLKASTVALWAGPPLLLVAGVVGLVVLLRRRARLPDHGYEADAPEPAPDPHLS